MMQWTAPLNRLDARALSWVALRRGRLLARTMRAASRTGDSVVVTAALSVWLAARPGRVPLLVAASTLVALVLFSVIKRLCRRTRPSVHALIAAPDRFSMPSGHATCAFAIAVSLSALVPALAPFAGAWALCVAASRVVLGVHYPFDAMAGAVLGALAAASVLMAFA